MPSYTYSNRVSLPRAILCSVIIVAAARTKEGTENKKPTHENKPNIVVIMTDEHNMKTLGCYRDLLEDKQAYPWGPGVNVETPHIDSLAMEGALFANCYSAAPLCTPARGSFLTSTFPSTHGANENHKEMNGASITFAQILKDKLGYHTSYMGKFHLNGYGKDPSVFGASEERSFGFDETKYLWNRGHWKYLTENEDGEVQGYTYEAEEMFLNQTGAYTTEFLVDRALNFIDEQKDSDQPFALMLSIPDPHGPNFVRTPYKEMYDHLWVDVPRTAQDVMNRIHGHPRPKWNKIGTKVMNPGDVPQSQMKDHIRKMKIQEERQKFYRPIFGMVKAIDDNVGRILHKLEALDLNDNTIVIFTSDHGDMMGEWARDEKQLPYRTSAGVPFIIRYPKQVTPGTLVKSAVSALDFTPTILSMVGIDVSNYAFEGTDRSKDLHSPEKLILDENSLVFSADTWEGTWASCMTSRYKLVLSNSEMPWLFDMEKDPDELLNFYGRNGYTEISSKMTANLLHAMDFYDFPLRYEITMLDRPVCYEADHLLDVPRLKNKSCSDLLSQVHYNDICNNDEVRKQCPIVCNNCGEDSSGYILVNTKQTSCVDVAADLDGFCVEEKVKAFCASACSGYSGME
mmetsp:Transcript_25627/g.38050  ORF Transcript_25627/g.38050 Transcript_25627/m.38050 type:complete len:627 (-) Transcript_25627:594-2474(-)